MVASASLPATLALLFQVRTSPTAGSLRGVAMYQTTSAAIEATHRRAVLFPGVCFGAVLTIPSSRQSRWARLEKTGECVRKFSESISRCSDGLALLDSRDLDLRGCRL